MQSIYNFQTNLLNGLGSSLELYGGVVFVGQQAVLSRGINAGDINVVYVA
jgi:hypothetical protein